MQRASIMVAASISMLFACTNHSFAASTDVTMTWLAGRWGDNGNCQDWFEFRRSGSSWTYRERDYNHAEWVPAYISAGPAGSLMAKVEMTLELQWVIRFHDRDHLSDVIRIKGDPSGTRHTGSGERCNASKPSYYAIAASKTSQQQAKEIAENLGAPWRVENSDVCENFTQGLWIVVVPARDKMSASALAAKVNGYAKECL